MRNRIILIQNKIKKQLLEEKLVYQKMLSGVSNNKNNNEDNSIFKTHKIFRCYSKRRWLVLAIFITILACIIHIFLRWLILGKDFL